MPLLRPGLCPSLSSDIVTKLARHGIKRVLDFICNDPERITSLCEISHKTVLAIRRVLLAQYSSFPVNGINLYDESVSTLCILPTKCQPLDDALASGFYTGEVTEIRGPSISGKTQFCMSVAASIIESGVQNVMFIDTSCGFSPERTAEIITKRSGETHSVSTALSHMRICQCTSAHQLLDILTTVRHSLNTQTDAFFSSLKAVIVDSISGVMVPYLEHASYVEGQSLLTTLKNELNSLAKDFSLAVIVTSNINYPDVSNACPQRPKCPMGYAWSTVACTVIDLHPQYSLFDRHACHKEHRPVTAKVAKSTHTTNCSSVDIVFNEIGIAELDES